LIILTLLALALILFVRKTQGMKRDVDAARAEFLQRVGYEYVSALTPKSSLARRKNTPEGAISHYFDVYSEPAGKVTAQAWQLESPKPRISFQLVEKKAVGTTRALLNLVGPFKRTLTLMYPGPYQLGDAELDARFALYANDAAAATSIVRQPDLRKELLELAWV